MNSKIIKIRELQVLLENEEERYKNLEEGMTDGEKASKKKNENLERNLDQLTLMYHQLVSQKSTMKVKKQIQERKIERLTGDNKKLTEDNKLLFDVNKKLSDKISSLDEENKRLSETIKELRNVSIRDTIGPEIYTGGNIKKIVKGGGDNIIFKTPQSSKKNLIIKEFL